MSFAVLTRLLQVLSVLVILSACSGVAVKEPPGDRQAAYQARAETLTSIPDWGFTGKLSLDDGEEGGSGRLQWSVEQDNSVLEFHGAMGRGAWRLETGPGGAILSEANGHVQKADHVNELIQERIGWPVPVDALQWWVRGLAAPGEPDVEELDENGLLVRLEQFDWSVEFNRYDSKTGLALPARLEATRGSYRVKLAIGRWQMSPGVLD